MECPDCGSETVVFDVPEDCRAFVRGEEATVALCPSCLSLHPATSSPAEEPDFDRVSDAFPTGEASVPMALLVGLLDSLALYRAEITDLLERVERAGTDPLLVIDRLATDPEVDAAVDLQRRRHQLAQLLE